RAGVPLKKGMRVLDLGCGKGLTSIFLAKKFGVTVFAYDLWTNATENFNRFQATGTEDLIIPIQSDALTLPFAEKYFDAVISVDSYHYFAHNDTYFSHVLKPVLKENAPVAIAIPGMKFEVYDNVPNEMKAFWDDEVLHTIRPAQWWKPKFASHLSDFSIDEMQCFQQAWDDWLCTENPYAIADREMMATDGGKYMNLLAVKGYVNSDTKKDLY
ncbi:MAG: methyltransferase domain-containing protein, partial [Spirochaetales bacterium]